MSEQVYGFGYGTGLTDKILQMDTAENEALPLARRVAIGEDALEIVRTAIQNRNGHIPFRHDVIYGFRIAVSLVADDEVWRDTLILVAMNLAENYNHRVARDHQISRFLYQRKGSDELIEVPIIEREPGGRYA